MIVIETLQGFLGLLIFYLDNFQDFLDATKALLAGEIGRVSGLVFKSSIVLDLFTGVLDLGET